MPARLPRVYVVRHGETEWSLSGQHTGKSEIPLTNNGEETIRALGPRVVGPGKLLDPKHISQVFCSPRIRAKKTLELLFEGNELPQEKVTIENLVQEWDYGEFEGRTAAEIRAEPSHEKWDIWTDGCPGGESAQEVSDRCDAIIEKILTIHQAHYEEGKDKNCDILIVSHGHFSRCFITRWCKLALTHGRLFVADVGAVQIGGYQHHSFDERSLLGVNLFGEI